MNRIQIVFVASALASLSHLCWAQSEPGIPSAAAMTSGECTALTHSALQRRLLEKEAQGVDALRRYLFITRGIYNLTMNEAVAFFDRDRAARRQCATVASASPQS